MRRFFLELQTEFHCCHNLVVFEEKILKEKETTRIVQDWKGNICEISNQYPVEYLRDPVDFVTRRWIKCPVETRDDWEQMKVRYNPDDPARYPANPQSLADELKDRTWPVQLRFSGPFWQLREWLGFETLCIMFHDDPEFVRKMIRFWTDYISKLLENTFSYFIPDEVHISEDMAYKGHSMISPKMVKEFLLPTWIQWGEIIKAAGVPLYGMDHGLEGYEKHKRILPIPNPSQDGKERLFPSWEG